MSDHTDDSTANRWTTSEVYYLCRWRTPALFLLTVVVLAGPILVFAWYLSLYPDWMPQTPDFTRGRRGWVAALFVWIFFVLFMKLPIWIRLSFLLGAGLQIIRLAVRRVLHAFDQKPDLSIGPEGIGGLDNSGFHVIPWGKIDSLVAYGPYIVIVGQEWGGAAFFWHTTSTSKADSL
ncbi:hypothetical protein [Microvirga sp. 2TAF3]|uniref:hypothetical protein n=1 Tax=Microvirga sp. 2TAF3 TaxID=3233014 RepID=UPI003F96B843